MKKIEKKEVDSLNLDDDMLFGSGMGFLVDDGPLEWNGGKFDKPDKTGVVAKPTFSKNEVAF